MIQKSTRQIAARMIPISLVFFLFSGACSQDEKPLPSPQTHKIVKAISKAPGLTEEKTPQIDDGLKPEPWEKSAAKATPTTAIEMKLERPKIVAEEALPREETLLGEEILPKEETGYYVVKRGDTLARVAGREDVYGDPLKWPILVRHNVDVLNRISTAEGLPDRALPDGMELRILTQDEVKDNLETTGERRWAVNVLSSPNEKEVIPVVVRLIRAAFPVYITRAKVKGTDYMRVRVGFFEGETEADAEGKRLMEVLKLPDFWAMKAKEEEVREFGGY
jgi:hypothetical protein